MGRELVWRQTSTLPEPAEDLPVRRTQGRSPKPDEVPPPPTRTLRVDQTDHQPVRGGVRRPQSDPRLVSGRQGIRFPEHHRARNVERRGSSADRRGPLADQVTYSVRFGKPIVLPATVNAVRRSDRRRLGSVTEASEEGLPAPQRDPAVGPVRPPTPGCSRDASPAPGRPRLSGVRPADRPIRLADAHSRRRVRRWRPPVRGSAGSPSD